MNSSLPLRNRYEKLAKPSYFDPRERTPQRRATAVSDEEPPGPIDPGPANPRPFTVVPKPRRPDRPFKPGPALLLKTNLPQQSKTKKRRMQRQAKKTTIEGQKQADLSPGLKSHPLFDLDSDILEDWEEEDSHSSASAPEDLKSPDCADIHLSTISSLAGAPLIFEGVLMGKPVRFLVDGGCTVHGIISTRWLKRAGLKAATKSTPDPVTLADGTKLQSTALLPNATFGFSNFVDHGSFHTLDLDTSFDGVLGKPWLAQWKPDINWESNTMTLHHHGRTTVVRPPVAKPSSSPCTPDFVVSALQFGRLVRNSAPCPQPSHRRLCLVKQPRQHLLKLLQRRPKAEVPWPSTGPPGGLTPPWAIRGRCSASATGTPHNGSRVGSHAWLHLCTTPSPPLSPLATGMSRSSSRNPAGHSCLQGMRLAPSPPLCRPPPLATVG